MLAPCNHHTPIRTPRSRRGLGHRGGTPAKYKAGILAEYESLSKADKGALL